MNQSGENNPNYRHGYCYIKEYRTWADIKGRCNNPKNKAYKWYGGRGIKVCEKWSNNFLAFYEDMGPKPSSELSIDRINPDGNYKPGNCRWATYIIQANNKTNTLKVKYKGQIKSLADWCRQYNVDY